MSKFEASISVKLDKSSISGLTQSIKDELAKKEIPLEGLKIKAGNVDVSGIVDSIKKKIQDELKDVNVNVNVGTKSGGSSGGSGGSGGSSGGSGSGDDYADASAVARLRSQINNALRTNASFMGDKQIEAFGEYSSQLKEYGEVAKSTFDDIKQKYATTMGDISKRRLDMTPTETSLKNLAAQYRIFAKNAHAYYKDHKTEIDETLRTLDAGGETAQKNANKYTERLAQMRNEAKALNQEGQSFLTMLGQQFTTFTKYTVVAEIFMKARQALQEMVQAVKEVDAAMTELKKVTDLSDSGYTQALEQAKTTAKEVGATVSDTVNATADFARLGYNVGDAAELARVALIYKNVGDGIEDVSQASESIISTMKAFGIAADDAINIVDKFNNVGKRNCRTVW